MFEHALTLARGFTRPLVVSTRRASGAVESSVGAYVLVNEGGWFVSAAHQFFVLQGQASGQADPVTNVSPWFGTYDLRLNDVKTFTDLDLAIGHLDGFDPASVPDYPVFKDPSRGMEPGAALCKLGFPFHDLRTTFDEQSGAFRLPGDALPLPFFPIEGIYTRNVAVGDRGVTFIETSSAGLRGQSGGPFVDTRGTVWGIQSHTTHYPLGFTPSVREGERVVTEHQFIHVGLGVHPAVVVEQLKEASVRFEVSDY